MTPTDIQAIESNIFALADYGEWQIVGDKILCSLRWIGDANTDTWLVYCEAAEMLEEVGYDAYDLYTDHDTVQFYVRPEIPGAVATVAGAVGSDEDDD